jgi:hypothetical protein
VSPANPGATILADQRLRFYHFSPGNELGSRRTMVQPAFGRWQNTSRRFNLNATYEPPGRVTIGNCAPARANSGIRSSGAEQLTITPPAVDWSVHALVHTTPSGR